MSTGQVEEYFLTLGEKKTFELTLAYYSNIFVAVQLTLQTFKASAVTGSWAMVERMNRGEQFPCKGVIETKGMSGKRDWGRGKHHHLLQYNKPTRVYGSIARAY